MGMESVGAATRSTVRPAPTRRQTDFVETAVLEELLMNVAADRILEIGCGEGRLTPTVQRIAREYVGIDVDPALVRAVADRAGTVGSRSSSYLCADLRNLPFADGSFSVAILVRLLHAFPNPRVVLREARRVLRAGGHLVLSMDPRPSIATLRFDLQSALERQADRVVTTFSTVPEVTIRSTARTGHVTTRRELQAAIRDAGFEVTLSRGTGLEALPVLRTLPPRAFVRLSFLLGQRAFVPTDFLLLRAR